MNLRAAGPGWLFCPADRPERFAKAATAADVVILDLEDGVAQADKPAARKALRETPLDPERTVVRINAAGTEELALDLDALAGTAYTTVMLSKTESAEQVRALAPLDVIALIETPRGAVFATEIAAAEGTVAMMWGAEDLAASLGATENASGGVFHSPFRLARDLCLIGAAGAEVAAIDTVYTDIDNLAGLEAETRAARRDGFSAKALIHPKHVDIVNAAFAPSDAERAWAETIVAAFAANPNLGTFRLDGKMIDKPHLRAAKKILGLP